MSKKIWSEADNQLLLVNINRPSHELAVLLGRSRRAVINHVYELRQKGLVAIKNGYLGKFKWNWTKEEDKVLLEHLSKADAEVSELVKRTPRAVSMRIYRLRKKGVVTIKNRSCFAQRSPAKVAFLCENCGTFYSRYPSQVKGKRHFCSTTCLYNWVRDKPLAVSNPKSAEAAKRRVTQVALMCKNCGSAFLARHSRAETAQFCSKSCRMSYNNTKRGNPMCRPEVREKLKRWVSANVTGKTMEERFGVERAGEIKQRLAQISIEKNTAWYGLIRKGKTYEEIFGKEKADEMKAKMAKTVKRGSDNPSFGKVRYPRCYYSLLVGHRVRSSWEEQTCLVLRQHGIKYEYEPSAFPVTVDGKVCTYTPDLRIAKNLFVEVKGPLFDFQMKKMCALLDQYPFKLVLVGADKYKTVPKHERLIHLKFIQLADLPKTIAHLKPMETLVKNEV